MSLFTLSPVRRKHPNNIKGRHIYQLNVVKDLSSTVKSFVSFGFEFQHLFWKNILEFIGLLSLVYRVQKEN